MPNGNEVFCQENESLCQNRFDIGIFILNFKDAKYCCKGGISVLSICVLMSNNAYKDPLAKSWQDPVDNQHLSDQFC